MPRRTGENPAAFVLECIVRNFLQHMRALIGQREIACNSVRAETDHALETGGAGIHESPLFERSRNGIAIFTRGGSGRSNLKDLALAGVYGIAVRAMKALQEIKNGCHFWRIPSGVKGKRGAGEVIPEAETYHASGISLQRDI